MLRKLQTHHLTISQLQKNNRITYTMHDAIFHQNKHYDVTHTKLSQLRNSKSLVLQSYLNTVNRNTYMVQCPLSWHILTAIALRHEKNWEKSYFFNHCA